MVARKDLIGILHDAIEDRLSFKDSCTGNDRLQAQAEGEISRYKDLMKRRRESQRLVLSKDDRETGRMASIRALNWRESFLDAVANVSDRAMVSGAERDVRVAREALNVFGGDSKAEAIESAQQVTIQDIARKGLGTHVVVTRENGVETRTITEDNVLLGRVITDVDGVVKAILADGTVANQPFREAFDAQQWIFNRMSKNQMLISDEDDEPELPNPW